MRLRWRGCVQWCAMATSWREEAARGCAVSLRRLAQIYRERGADYELTIGQLTTEVSS